MNWQIWLVGVVMLSVAGTAVAPLAALVRVGSVTVNDNPPAWESVAVNDDASVVNDDASVVNNHASDGMPSSTVSGPDSLPCSTLLNSHWGCDDAMASGLRPDNGFVDYALGDLFLNQGARGSPYARNGNRYPESQPSTDDQTWNQAAPGSPYVRNADGYPVSQPSTDDQPAGRTRSAAGWTAPQPFWAPQFTQWPMARGTDPLPTAAVYSILDAPNGDQDQSGVIDLGIDLGSLPAANGPTTIDLPSCPPSCHDLPVAANGSPAAVAEPATLSLIGLGMLAFAGLRRRA